MTTSTRWWSVGCLALPLVVAAGCSRSSAEAPARPDGELPAVAAVQARQGVVPLRERLTGTVRASGEVGIFPQINGPIAEVFVENGASVRRGEPLVRIQPAGSQAQLQQRRSSLEAARAQLGEAEARHRELAAEYERQKTLGDRGLVPMSTVDSLRSQVEAARAAAASARAQVATAEASVAETREVQAQTLVRAPITGRVGQRNAEVGMLADTQTALFVIGRLDNMRVEVPVTQDVLTRVEQGQRVELRPGTASSQPIEASVSRISPFLQAGSFTAEVEVDVPNETGALVPGMFVTVDIFYGESDAATLVPTSALYENSATGERGVYVTAGPPPPLPAGDGQGAGRPEPIGVSFRPASVVAEAAQTAGVRGVRPDEWVVVIGQHLLAASRSDGDPQARVRPMEWDRIMEMQQLQREDLLREFLARQQESARARRGRQ